MMNLHPHLQRQISKHFGNKRWQDDSALVSFFESVNQSYLEFDRSQKLSDKAFQLADQEYHELVTKLKEAESRMKVILDGALDAVISMDISGKVIDWNPEAENVFGYTYQQAHGKLLADLIIPETLKVAHSRGLENFHKTGHGPVLGKRIEIMARRSNGDLLPVELTISVLQNKQEKFFNAFIRDITERKKSETALKQFSERLQEMVNEQTIQLQKNEARLRTITENAPDLIMELNRNGEVLFINRVFQNYKMESLLGKSIYDFTQPGDHAKIRTSIEKVFALAIPVQYEIDALGADAEIKSFLAALAPVKINDKVDRVILSTHDISNIKKVEKELIKAKEEAEAASDAKSEFLANVSHELRTPLNGVIGFVDLLTKTPVSEVQHKYLKIVSHSASTLLNLIDDILNFSRLESGKVSLLKEPFDLRLACHQVIDMIQHQVIQKNLQLSVNISDSIPSRVLGDEIKIKQVLTNLLSNSVKFTSKGEIAFSAMVLRVNEVELEVRFEVRDTGIGIRPENQQKIFQAFMQEDVTMTKQYGGTGLGLTISNKLLELMGTRLRLHSEIGKGSIFYFNITFNLSNEL